MYRCDSHIHTHLSFDGNASATVDTICRKAVACGLDEITITDHCDINGEVEAIYAHYDLTRGREEFCEARERYANCLHVNFGIELGQPHQYPEAAAALIREGGFDFVLGSLHNLTGVPDFSFMNFTEMPDALMHQLFARTLSEATEVIRFPGIHALAHLTYPLRYMAKAGRSFDLAPHLDAIRALFAEMRERGIDLEVNYSTLRTGLGFTMPDTEVLTLWQAAGGSRVTLGSDAHTPRDVAGGLDDAIARLQAMGINKTVTYRGGQPHEHSIAN